MIITPYRRQIDIILKTGFYAIPRFQRPYRWKRQHVEEFWRDLFDERPGEHFIGSLVIHKGSDGRFQIVDGQQRLTTIVLALCVLRERLRALGATGLAKGVHHYIERPDDEDQMQFVVHPTSSSPYLHNRIMLWDKHTDDAKPGPEEGLLKDAYDYLTELVSQHLEEVASGGKQGCRELVNIRDRILKLNAIVVELDREDDAYFVFETLNTRGMDLKQTDLVKNYIMRHLRPNNRTHDAYRLQWDRMVDLLEESDARIDTDKFLLHHWLSKYEYSSGKKLFRGVKRHFKGRERALALLDELCSNAGTYRQIVEPAFRRWTREERHIAATLMALGDFDVEQDLPMVLAVMRCYAKRELKLRAVRRMLSSIEKFHFAFTAITSSRSSGGISAMYASAARRLTAATSGANRAEVMRELQEKLRGKKPSYDEFLANFRELRYSSLITKRKNLVTYVLTKMLTALGPAGSYDLSSMTIEHVAPEHPPTGSSWSVKSLAVAEIGNLLLVTEGLNRELGTKPFKDKQRILRREKGRIWVDDSILNAKDWSAATIADRTEAMAKLAYDEVWAG